MKVKNRKGTKKQSGVKHHVIQKNVDGRGAQWKLVPKYSESNTKRRRSSPPPVRNLGQRPPHPVEDIWEDNNEERPFKQTKVG